MREQKLISSSKTRAFWSENALWQYFLCWNVCGHLHLKVQYLITIWSRRKYFLGAFQFGYAIFRSQLWPGGFT